MLAVRCKEQHIFCIILENLFAKKQQYQRSYIAHLKSQISNKKELSLLTALLINNRVRKKTLYYLRRVIVPIFASPPMPTFTLEIVVSL